MNRSTSESMNRRQAQIRRQWQRLLGHLSKRELALLSSYTAALKCRSFVIGFLAGVACCALVLALCWLLA